MAVFMINICKFDRCGIIFKNLADLIQHIEENHIDNESTLQYNTTKEIENATCLPLSYVLRFYTNKVKVEEDADELVHTNGLVPPPGSIMSPASETNVFINKIQSPPPPPLVATQQLSSPSIVPALGSSPQGSEPSEDLEEDSMLEDSNDSWTLAEEYSSEYILKHGSKMTTPMDGNVEKPFACPVPGCKKRYKNVNGIKYHSKNGHKTDGRSPSSTLPPALLYPWSTSSVYPWPTTTQPTPTHPCPTVTARKPAARSSAAAGVARKRQTRKPPRQRKPKLVRTLKPQSARQKASPGTHQNPNSGAFPGSVLRTLNPISGGRKSSPGNHNPDVGFPSSISGAQNPITGSQKASPGTQNPNLGFPSSILGAQNPMTGSQKASPGTQNPNLGFPSSISGAHQNQFSGGQKSSPVTPNRSLGFPIVGAQNPNSGAMIPSPKSIHSNSENLDSNTGTQNTNSGTQNPCNGSTSENTPIDGNSATKRKYETPKSSRTIKTKIPRVLSFDSPDSTRYRTLNPALSVTPVDRPATSEDM